MSAQPQIRKLVLVRESAMYNRQLLHSMLVRTLSMHARHFPGEATVREWGLDAFDGKVPGLQIRSFKRNRCRAVLYEHFGVHYLVSEGSAAKMNEQDSENDFAMIIDEVAQIVRPEEVFVASFSRLVRSLLFVSETYRSFIQVGVRRVWADTTPIDLDSPAGQMMWSTFSMVATMERDLILARLTAGRVARFLSGDWVGSPDVLPVGYTLAGSRIRLCDSEAPKVPKMLAVLADETLTAAEMAARLGRIGVTTRRIQQQHGKRATVAQAGNPSSVVRTLMGYGAAYSTGQLIMRLPNHLRVENGHIAGVPIVKSQVSRGAQDHGELVLAYALDVPEGGWASKELLDLVVARHRARQQSSKVSRDTHKVRGPLAGQGEWSTAKGHESRLILVGRAYQVRCRVPVESHRRSFQREWTNTRITEVETHSGIDRTENRRG